MQAPSAARIRRSHYQQPAVQHPRFLVPPTTPPPLQRVGVRALRYRLVARTGATSTNSSDLSSSSSAGVSLGLADPLSAALVTCMVLASPADSAALLAAPAGNEQPAATRSNPALSPLASGDLYFSDGMPYRSVADLICASYSATLPAPSVNADTPPASPAMSAATQQPVSSSTSLALQSPDASVTPNIGEAASPRPSGSPADTASPSASASVASAPGLSGGANSGLAPLASQVVVGELALLGDPASPRACEVDRPSPGTVPASAGDLLAWEEQQKQQHAGASSVAGGHTDADTVGVGDSSVGVDSAPVGGPVGLRASSREQQVAVRWQGLAVNQAQNHHHHQAQRRWAAPTPAAARVLLGGTVVRLPLATLTAWHEPPWWLQLVALGMANVLVVKVVLALMQRLGDRAEPLTLVRLQLGLVHPSGAPGGRQLKELRSRLRQLTAMKQVGQSGLWVIVEETMLELSRHQQCAALADVSALHLESKLEAYDVFGQFAREEGMKARAEEAQAHVEGDNSCVMDWAAEPSSGSAGKAGVAQQPGLGLLQWLSVWPQLEESGCDDALIVTVIVVARGYLDVPTKDMSCWQDCCSVMKTVCGLTSDRLVAVDVMWAPSVDGTFITRDMLVSDYANLKPLRH